MPVCNLAMVLPNWFGDYIHWWLAAFVVIVGIALFGRSELRRLNLHRIVAISSVSFAESLRRKVLWVTPLGILGVIAISLLQHPVDQQEAIRQTIKFCLFASGTLVTITAIILACTNLPREIENRVIFTIVTKPITRLEIVLGKVLGFIRVSGLIVLIMGLFTFVFLEWQNWQLSRQLAGQLQTDEERKANPVLAGYQAAGLLNTKSLEKPVDFEVYNHLPTVDGPQWITGGEFYSYNVPFDLNSNDEALLGPAAEDPPQAEVLVINTLRLKRNVPTPEDLKTLETRKVPMEGNFFGPPAPGQKPPMPIPQLSMSVVDWKQNVIAPPTEINNGKLTNFPPKANGDGTYTVQTPLTPAQVGQLLNARRFAISVVPETPSVEYEVSSMPTVLLVIKPSSQPQMIKAIGPPKFTSHMGRYGMQIPGNPSGNGAVADFRFKDVSLPSNGSPVTFRFRCGLVRGGDYDYSQEYSPVGIRIRNRTTGAISPILTVHAETNRDVPVPIPAEDMKYLAGGNFDVMVQGLDNGQWVGFSNTSVQLISAEHSFVFNLFKSLFILWLFSILVVIVAVFTSTFLSWPIAIMLTLLILLGNWGVQEMGDALSPGVGRNVAQDLGFGKSAAQSQVISTSVEHLAKMLTVLSSVLPDLSKFPVMEDITRGVSISPLYILDSIWVLLYYGLPMIVLSFIILKNKEVAP